MMIYIALTFGPVGVTVTGQIRAMEPQDANMEGNEEAPEILLS